MTTSRQLALGTAASYLRYALSFMVSFLLVPLMVTKLGTEQFGLWSLLFSLLSVFGLLDLGLAVGAVKIAAEAKGEGSTSKRNQLFSSLFTVYALLSLAALTLLFLFSWLLGPLFSLEGESLQQALALLWILGARVVVLQLPFSLFKSALFGAQELTFVNVTSAGQNLLYGCGVWAALMAGGDVVAVAWVSLIAMLLEHIVYLVGCYRRLQDFSITPSLQWNKELIELLSFSRYQFLSDLAAVVLLQMDLILVQLLFSLEEVALYAIALRLVTHAFYLVKQFVNLLGPMAATRYKEGGDAALGPLYLAGCRIGWLAALPLGGVLLTFGEPFIRFWAGGEVAAAYPLLAILMVAMLVGVPGMVASTLLAMSGDHIRTSMNALLGVAVNLLFSLIGVYFFGLVGIALGTLSTRFIVDLPRLVLPAHRRFNLSNQLWMQKVFQPFVAPLALHLATLLFLQRNYHPSSLAEVILLMGVSGAAFCLPLLPKRRLIWQLV